MFTNGTFREPFAAIYPWFMMQKQLSSFRIAHNCGSVPSPALFPLAHSQHINLSLGNNTNCLDLKFHSNSLGFIPKCFEPLVADHSLCISWHHFHKWSFSYSNSGVQPSDVGTSLSCTLRCRAKDALFGFRRRKAYVRKYETDSFIRKLQLNKTFQETAIISTDDSYLKETLRLVECSMFAASAGLAYFLSNLLQLEAYFGCFLPLPIVMASMRWGASAGRKTMAATAILLLVLSGPLKATCYLLTHGFVGLAMGALWRWKINWGLSIIACTLVRSISALGFIGLSSWLLRDNILALITINAHASICYMLAAFGVNVVPTMGMVYLIFATLLLVNCGSFVFLLHVLYAIFLHRLGIKISISMPAWVQRAF